MTICKRCGSENLTERHCGKCGHLSTRDIAEAFCAAMEMQTEALNTSDPEESI
jgi:ribosomal protein L37E